MEELNGGNDDGANRRALQACKLVVLSGSDVHCGPDIGIYAAWFPESVTSMREMIQSMKSGRCRPGMRVPDRTCRIVKDFTE